mgnify:CR=1 FL=1
MREYLMSICAEEQRRQARRKEVLDKVAMLLTMVGFWALLIAGWMLR